MGGGGDPGNCYETHGGLLTYRYGALQMGGGGGAK